MNVKSMVNRCRGLILIGSHHLSNMAWSFSSAFQRRRKERGGGQNKRRRRRGGYGIVEKESEARESRADSIQRLEKLLREGAFSLFFLIPLP